PVMMAVNGQMTQQAIGISFLGTVFEEKFHLNCLSMFILPCVPLIPEHMRTMAHPDISPNQFEEGIKNGYYMVNLSLNQTFGPAEFHAEEDPNENNTENMEEEFLHINREVLHSDNSEISSDIGQSQSENENENEDDNQYSNQDNDVLNEEDPYLNENNVETDDQDNDQEEDQEQFSELSMDVFDSDMFQSSQSDNILSEDDSIHSSSVNSSQNYQRDCRQRSQQQKNLSEGEDGNMGTPFSSQSYQPSNDDPAESENGLQVSSSVSTASYDISQRSSGSSRRSSTSGGSSNDITAAMARTTIRSRSGSSSIFSNNSETSSNQMDSPKQFRFGRNNSAQQNLNAYIANSRRGIPSSTYFQKHTAVNQESLSKGKQPSTMRREVIEIRDEISPSPERQKRQFDKVISAEIPSGKRPRRLSIDTNDTQRASTRVSAEASSSSAPLHNYMLPNDDTFFSENSSESGNTTSDADYSSVGAAKSRGKSKEKSMTKSRKRNATKDRKGKGKEKAKKGNYGSMEQFILKF
ncbi:hypothetical protein, partial, partial [Parasitella parasitica]